MGMVQYVDYEGPRQQRPKRGHERRSRLAAVARTLRRTRARAADRLAVVAAGVVDLPFRLRQGAGAVADIAGGVRASAAEITRGLAMTRRVVRVGVHWLSSSIAWLVGRVGRWTVETAVNLALQRAIAPVSRALGATLAVRLSTAMATAIVASVIVGFLLGVVAPVGLVAGVAAAVLAGGLGGALLGGLWGLLAAIVGEAVVSELLNEPATRWAGPVAGWCLATAAGYLAGRVVTRWHTAFVVGLGSTAWAAGAYLLLRDVSSSLDAAGQPTMAAWAVTAVVWATAVVPLVAGVVAHIPESYEPAPTATNLPTRLRGWRAHRRRRAVPVPLRARASLRFIMVGAMWTVFVVPIGTWEALGLAGPPSAAPALVIGLVVLVVAISVVVGTTAVPDSTDAWAGVGRQLGACCAPLLMSVLLSPPVARRSVRQPSRALANSRPGAATAGPSGT